MSTEDYISLKEYATERQADAIDALIKHGTAPKAARALGIAERNLRGLISRVKVKAAKQGYAPEYGLNKPIPAGYEITGTSTLTTDENGDKIWIKTRQDKEALDALLEEALEAFNSRIKRVAPVKPPKNTDTDLLNCYVITDYHLGAMSWHEETGEDWDIKIAEDLLVKWFSCAIKTSPKAETAIFAQLGDFLHFDGLDAITPANHNILDADTRFQKIVRVAIRVIRRVIQMLLEKHDKVHVIMAEGNHDPASSIWLREWLCALYENEDRVFVDLSPNPYYCYEHGKTSVFFHHGHKRRPANIDHVFTAQFRDVFGRTKHSYAHLGHLHNDQVKETNLMKVEQHRTLAAKDAYASRGGWLSGRDAKCITYHKEYGEVARITISPEMAA